jgi:hypothetical protein
MPQQLPRVWTVVTGLFLLGLSGAVCVAYDGRVDPDHPELIDTWDRAPAGGGPDDPRRLPGLDVPVRDATFEYVIERVDCARSRLGGDRLGASARGRFCRVTLTVRNIARQPRTFHAAAQTAYDESGTPLPIPATRDAADRPRESRAAAGASSFVTEINPGNRVRTVLVFDAPEGIALATLQLRDVPGSDGIRVRLTR